MKTIKDEKNNSFRSLIKMKKITHSGQGSLSFFEANKDIPFGIKRIYFTYDVPVGIKRGKHAHKQLKQLLWSPYGELEVILDDGNKTESFLLDSPDKGLLVINGVWHDVYWRKEGSILCVAASEYYNAEDYIRDYTVFLRYVNEGYWKDENKLQCIR